MDAFIFLHGKQGGPNYDQCTLGKLADEFVHRGHLVSYKPYHWGYKDVFTDYAENTVQKIINEVDDLKLQGATRIHLIGFSLGANLSLYCVSKLPDTFKSIVLLAPAHNIHLQPYKSHAAKLYQLSKDLISAGHGNTIYHFVDFNSTRKIHVPALPLHYISFIDQDGPCNMEKSIDKIKNPISVLMISGSNDKTQALAESIIWAPLVKTEHSRLILTSDTHYETCPLKYNLIQDWIGTLP
jgi:esterase/lipase